MLPCFLMDGDRPRATDFSIAAIMARSAARPMEKGLTDINDQDPLADSFNDYDVDIEDCSDTESIRFAPSPEKEVKQETLTPSPQPSPVSSTVASISPEPAAVEEVHISSGKDRKKIPSSKLVPKCTCDELLAIECHLETKELWDKFHDLGTEMIITKTGRRMFPTVRVAFTGPLRADVKYTVILDVAPVDSKRYRYAYHRSSWLVAGKADPPAPQRLYSHPDCPMTGDQLRKQIISFEKVKLTNNDMDKHGQIVLNSMHRYQPRVFLVKLRPEQNQAPTDLEGEQYRSYLFSETVFTAVTAYQNQLITKLKIDSNPFAKGFRDSTRLTDFERDTMDTLLLDPSYTRPPPLRLHPDPEVDAILSDRARAAALGNLLWSASRPPCPDFSIQNPAMLLHSAMRNQPSNISLPTNLWTQWASLHGLNLNHLSMFCLNMPGSSGSPSRLTLPQVDPRVGRQFPPISGFHLPPFASLSPSNNADNLHIPKTE
ncbi:T-box transcription factor TBX20-like [Artemia franciscana]|uniref:T-box domain-containing protein n=1 Tax=Artemia franciscana TaxID=6661 RepID=A0AA88L045_ARTSF|nr:hypothetical protein QYM36_014245 [Artemia franciscana]